MRNIKTVIFIFMVILSGSACHYIDDFERGNGNIISKEIKVEGFARVNIGGNFEVMLIESKDPKVVIEIDENLMSLIQVNTEDQLLDIIQLKNIFSKNGLKVKIYYSDLEYIKVTGAALVENKGILLSKNLELKLEGAGVVRIHTYAENLEADLSGAGKVELSGKVQRQKLKLSGAGGLDAYGLESEDCDIRVSGIGSAEVFVTSKLTAKLEGLGGIKYIGDPKSINKDISGIGVIEKGTWELEETVN